MQEPTTATVSLTSSSSSDVMSEILRQGAQRMLATVIGLFSDLKLLADLGHLRVLAEKYVSTTQLRYDLIH